MCKKTCALVTVREGIVLSMSSEPSLFEQHLCLEGQLQKAIEDHVSLCNKMAVGIQY